MTHNLPPTRSADLAIWCAIPVYNNASTIVDVARRCRLEMDHVLVIDDGSTDADLRELLKPLDVTVVHHPVNRGKGAALMTAFHYVAGQGGQYVITIDGDGQHFPEDIPRFIDQLSPATILIGRRTEITGTMPKSSLFGRDFSDFWIYVEAGAAVSDTQSGFRAYPLPQVLRLQCKAIHYNFEMEIVTRAIWAGLAVGSVPIRVWYPEAAERISSFRPFRDNLRISLLHLRLVLRQLLPIPHRRIVTPHGRRFCVKRALAENTSALGLSIAAAVSVLPSVVLWPWGGIIALYVAWRLHLNKALVIAIVAMSLLPIVPDLCMKAGRAVTGQASKFQWFIGSHLVAFTALVLMIVLIYSLRTLTSTRRAA